MGTEANAELQHVRNYWQNIMKPKSPIYTFLLNDIVLTSATKGQVKAQLKVLPVHVNSKGTLHGVVSSCLMDWAGGIAIISTDLDRDNSGLSTDIHTTYVSTAFEGDLLEIESNASKVALLWLSRQFKLGMLGKEVKSSPMAPIPNTSKRDED